SQWLAASLPLWSAHRDLVLRRAGAGLHREEIIGRLHERDRVDRTAVDFVEDMGGAAFKVTNPNAASGCGCGSSFSI
ncbi:MAG: HesB/IscA family protein, partial [Sphingomicrobium sp.]